MQPQLNLTATLNVVAYALFIYDYVLTFADEMERFWSRPRRSWAFLLFMAIRYITLLSRVPAFGVNFLPSSFGPYSSVSVASSQTSLHPDSDIAIVLAINIPDFFHQVVMTLRVYAMYGENRRILFLLLSFIGIGLGVGLWGLIIGSSLPTEPLQNQGCLRSISQQQFVFIRLFHFTESVLIRVLFSPRTPGYAALWGVQLIFDAMVFVLTVWKLLRMESMCKRSLVDVLLRDGAMYFAVVTAINVANIVIFIMGQPDMKSLLSSPTIMLCATLISRLMLNLRDPAEEDIGALCVQNIDIDIGETSSRMRRPLYQGPFSRVDWRSVQNSSTR
ncbi:hypothetical protein EDC04DRAFT_3095582 [Pisolithus marmoratus]|nr:hypothetical protein EDC04DRAFT_3095582 [Pisolithus marmoratus]